MNGRKALPVIQEGGPAEAGPTDGGRRAFLRAAAVGAAAAGLAACDFDPQLRKHFRELSKDEIARLLERAKEKNRKRFGRETQVDATPAIPGVEFGYGLDLSRCVGCRRCVYACAKENNTSRAKPQIHWIRVLELEKERGVDLTHAEVYYDADAVPRPGKFYMPVQCQQCRKPPCVKACPTQATWKEPDGIVVVDYDWCIGCRACMAACPYGARHFNWGAGTLPAAELNPDQHFLGNRPRPRGVVDKCTFCIQRSRKGRYTACVEACPVGARKFGNLLDPESEIRKVIETKRVYVLKEDVGTEPTFFYFYAT
jgi:molybdopterin-containing oxidoreductase family iron-sulfur binding subunit